ncbi:MAG TPA: hypothetical protein VLA30_14635 [Burkholderiales bacterium]|nr:hypothetical protein [Burkholderiales bacterium]
MTAPGEWTGRQWARVAMSLAFLLLAAGCAPGMQNVRVELPTYQAPRAARAAEGRPTVRVEAVKDSRSDSVGSHIGERTTIGNISMGSIELEPPPTDVIAALLRAEFAGMSHGLVKADERFTVAAQLRKFQVLTPATALYWDLNGAIELDLSVRSREGRTHEARYAATCTDRTYLFPSEDLIRKVVAACIGRVGESLRGDAALAKFMGGP